ncbi:MAG: ATP-dependent zinc metalloprotease FtsH [Myxococcales bacterium]|nr:ATP-dependent zinc metalloprotease FtsH [Myxococcales bacterium]MDH5306900.1 ATP-dependent zinc metalloprotease FtsH [Myxococcales bacterium]MDH5566293.1 ATP-dependent zinc metalloprotease FtsH [Myxococcales bacterium]
MILLLLTMLRQGPQVPEELAYSDFLRNLEQDRIDSVVIEESHILVTLKDGSERTTFAPAVTDDLLDQLHSRQVNITARPKPEGSLWRQVAIMWLPLIFFIGVWLFFIRQMQAGGGKAMSFGKSRARLLTQDQRRVTFEDVAGVEESKIELEEIIEFLRDPKKFTRLGGRIPKGVLLIGPPGTGKTLLARAVAGEAGVPFFSISGSDFVEMFVGVGASRVRDLFLQGKKNEPCIIFIDEIDAVGRHRGAGMGGGHDEREQTLNQLLVEMDGFESNEAVILIAATNRPDVLDPALLRPGRFDRRVVVPRPDLRGRVAILRVHTKHVNLADDVDLEVIARGTPGFVGADLQNLVNEACLLAARRDAQQVYRVDFESAKDKVILGTERRSLIMSEEDKRETAYHEAGHALVALLEKHADPVHKVTIIPRGMALGVTMTMPEQDQYGLSREQLIARIKHGMGGRAAEDLVFNRFTTGAANDLKQVTDLARRMVCSYGMNEKIGPVSLSDDDHDVFLGRDFMQRKDYSERKAQEIDEEICKLLKSIYDEAKQLLSDHRDTLDRISHALLERETLDAAELRLLLEGKPLPPLPVPVPAAKTQGETPAKRAKEKTEGKFSGDELPDPAPVPG